MEMGQFGLVFRDSRMCYLVIIWRIGRLVGYFYLRIAGDLFLCSVLTVSSVCWLSINV